MGSPGPNQQELADGWLKALGSFCSLLPSGFWLQILQKTAVADAITGWEEHVQTTVGRCVRTRV